MSPRLFVVSLLTEDVPLLVHFYRDVIGLQLLPHASQGIPHFDLGGPYLVILSGRPPSPASSAPRFPMLAIAVPDLDAGILKLHAHAVKTSWGLESGLDSRWVMFHDPAGNLIELVEFIHKK